MVCGTQPRDDLVGVVGEIDRAERHRVRVWRRRARAGLAERHLGLSDDADGDLNGVKVAPEDLVADPFDEVFDAALEAPCQAHVASIGLSSE